MKTNSLDFDAQVLREKILDLAMRRKLVKQDPNDEPASVLLEKIKAEKAELVKEGKIKKSKALPEITDDEKPFDIPDSWEWVRLGDLFTIFNGKAFKPKDWTEKGIPIVRIQNLNNPLAEYHLYDGPIEERYHLNGNELLFAWSGTPGTSFGAHIWKDQEAVLNQHIFKLEFNQKELDKGFLKNAMNFRILKLIDDAHGSAGLRHITKKMFEETIIPLPPLSEQSRIAAKIAQLFALLRKVESSTQQYAKLQTLLKSKVLDLAMRGKLVKQDPNDEPASVLLEKVKAEKEQLIKEKKIKKSKPLPPITDEEKPFEIHDSWEWVRLGDVTNFVGTGMVIPANKQFDTFTSQMLPYFKMNNIGNWDGEFGVNNWTYVLKTQNSDNYLLKSGQLLFNTRNSRELVGKTTIVPDNLNKKILANNNILRIESFGKMKLKYINYYLISPFSRHMFLNMTAATTNVAAIYQKQLNKLLVPLPPLEEQKRIVKKIDQLFILLKRDKNYTKVK